MPKSKAEALTALLDQFSRADSLDERLAALPELIKLRALHAARDDARLDAALGYLGSLAARPQVAEERLRAIAALARIATVKSLAKKVEGILHNALDIPVPELGLLKDPDDRFYVASALHCGNGDWVAEYAATWVVEEKQAEKTRQELVLVLFKKLPTLAQVFQALAVKLKAFRPETKNPADSVARRLERILQALRPQTIALLMEPGEDTGRLIHEMLRAAFSGSGCPETPKVAQKIIEEIGGLLHDIARTQISLVVEASLYAALDVPRAWFSLPEWRYLAEKSANLRMVAHDIREALTLLAKQGVTDSDLYEQLAKASGSREAAARITGMIAKQHPEIDEETRAWLSTGGRAARRSVHGAFDESRRLSADPVLATLMVDGAQLRESLTGLPEDLRAELRLLEPGLVAPLDTLVTRCRAVLSDVDALATKRGLQFRWKKGDVVDYAPLVHELVGGPAQGIRKVKVVQPMVLREGADGTETVVRKAVVDKI